MQARCNEKKINIKSEINKTKKHLNFISLQTKIISVKSQDGYVIFMRSA